MFESADPYKLPPRSLASSLTLHCLGLALLCWGGLPNSALRPRRLHAVLIAPARELPPVHPRSLPAPTAPQVPAPEHRTALLRQPLPSPRKSPAPALEPPPQAPTPILLTAPPPALPPAEAVTLVPPVRVGTFQTQAQASAATPESRVEASRVKAAGFGAAEAGTESQTHGRVALEGAFGAATASRAASRKGLAGATGFGDAHPAESSGGEQQRRVLASNFGDASVGAAARHASASVEASTVPAEILDKPRPAYTEEARKLSIQGEVLLEVALDASGSVRVLSVVRGLGHGLDESAIGAARQIRFRPARRDGQPVDTTAVVHIVFQLAY